MDISGIRRRSSAEESAKKYFQTTNLIISHFKREADKKLVYQLSSEQNNLTNLLIASSAVHCFHYLGVRTKVGGVAISDIKSAENFEAVEKKEIFNSIAKILGKSIHYELELSLSALNYENILLDAMISGIDLQDENFMLNLKDQLEEHLVSALNKYPTVFFYDHIGELMGYTPVVKSKIIQETSQLKTTSIELEKDLIKEEQADKYIEISTLNLLVQQLMKNFEFSSVKDLKLETFPIRKMLSEILNYRLNIYPVSLRALKSYREATKLKQKILEELKKANSITTSYEETESNIINSIIDELKIQAKKGPNNFVYFLENVLELSFEEVYNILAQYGAADVSLFCSVQEFDLDRFFKDSTIFRLTKMTFLKLNKMNNDFMEVEKKLNEMKRRNLCVTEKNVEELLSSRKEHEMNYIKDACKMANINFDDFLNLHDKKKIIEKMIKKKFPVKWMSAYIMFYDVADIYQNLGRLVYFTYFTKICRQIARILETYVKLKEDKGLILLGLKRISSANANDDWVIVKIEELIIQRIMNRQKELSTIFGISHDAFLVNSFIFARLIDSDLTSTINLLKNEPSSIYEGVCDLNLPNDLISPVSYVIAYDILNRFKDFQELSHIQQEQIIETQLDQNKKRNQQLKEAQLLNTLNWIEKKIISTVMSVKNINPTSLYWNEKDQIQSRDSAKNHSELKDRKICSKCGIDTTEKECPDHPNSSHDALPLDLLTQYYNFALTRIKELWPKLKIPPYNELFDDVYIWMNDIMSKRLKHNITNDESKLIIEGERLEVANSISKSIGEHLDKALYKKFKANLKNQQ